MNCIVYARVSTDKQAEKDLSIPAQLQAMRDYARQQGWSVMEEFVEPGASGTTADRPALQRLLARVQVGTVKVDVVIVHKLDRMARNIEDHVAIRATLKRSGVRLASVTENVDDSVSGQLIENIMASFAQFYSANLATEVKKGMRQKVLNGGWPHRPPRGYMLVKRPDGTGNDIEIHPKDGPLMRRAFELYGSGWHSMRAVAALLARDGLLSRNGGPIPQAHFRRLLSSSFYIGKVRWHAVECPGRHTPLVSSELFDRVQGLVHQRYRNPGMKGSVQGFPVRGLAVCASCRGHMTAERHGRWGYYRCSRQSFRKALCDAKFCNAERAHQGLIKICRQIQLNRVTASTIQNAAERLINERQETRARRAQGFHDERSALLAAEMRLTDGFTTGDVSPALYKARIAQIRSQRSRLEEASDRTSISAEQLAERVAHALQLATSVADLYEAFDELKRAELLRTVFSAIVLDHNGVVGVTLKPPFDDLLKPSAVAAGGEGPAAQRLVDAA
ncbi:MAG: recombinase family protein [Planctomycetaceae bacterium]|nr:recombinase family protein [Planctomycetaceae bacterium]